jgi:hypothetical protein
MRGEVVLHARLFDKIKRGVVIAEGIRPSSDHERGEGINVLTVSAAGGQLCKTASPEAERDAG